jgi:hypothetical protein
MLLAHAQHLARTAAAMHLCHIRPGVMATLEDAHASLLIEAYPTVDEAVLATWK